MASTPSFWHEYKARLRSYIINRVQDKHAADDILQEVFLKAHTSLHTVKTPGNIKSLSSFQARVPILLEISLASMLVTPWPSCWIKGLF